MKRIGILMIVFLAAVALLFVGCSNNEDVQQPTEQQSGQQEADSVAAQVQTAPVDAVAQEPSVEVVTVTGLFQGLADGHSAEVLVDDVPIVFQFYDQSMREQLEIMEIDTAIRFAVKTDAETGVKTIVELYDTVE